MPCIPSYQLLLQFSSILHYCQYLDKYNISLAFMLLSIIIVGCVRQCK
ncbi:DUF2644 domain-containing protein [Limosilactobacillus reuteri]